MVPGSDFSDSHVGCSAPTTNLSAFEQHASLGAGAVLFAFAMLHRSPLRSLLFAGLGVGCIYRGVTGHCHLYDALGVNTSESVSSDTADQDGNNAESGELTHAGNRVDKDRFEKLRSTQVDRGRDEREAIEIAAEEVKELRRREGRSKEELQVEEFDERR